MTDLRQNMEQCLLVTREVVEQLLQEDCSFEVVEDKLNQREIVINDLKKLADNRGNPLSEDLTLLWNNVLKEDELMRKHLLVWKERLGEALSLSEQEEKAEGVYTAVAPREGFITGRLEG
jgi:hypothetical protein